MPSTERDRTDHEHEGLNMKSTRKEFGKLWKQGKLGPDCKGFEAYYKEFQAEIDAELKKGA